MADEAVAQNMCRFYVYEHWRPDTDACFYVGKGRLRRLRETKRNLHHQNIVRKLVRLGLKVDVRVIAKDLDEKSAFSLEIERIAFWKTRDIKLTNRTDGGEGPSGWKREQWHSDKINAVNRSRMRTMEEREKLRQALLGHIVSEETRKKISLAGRGRVPSIEQREKLRVTMKKRMSDSTIRAAYSKLHTGRKHTPEACAKIGDAHRGKSVSEAVRDKIRQKLLGTTHTVEQKRKISETTKRTCALPEIKAKRSAHTRATWADPVMRANRLAGMRAARLAKQQIQPGLA